MHPPSTPIERKKANIGHLRGPRTLGYAILLLGL
jgi:hypothetical protein